MEALKSFCNEVWNDVVFEGNFTNTCGLQVSNYGRVRSVDMTTREPLRMLNGARQEGYAIIRKKMYSSQPVSAKKKLDTLRKEIAALTSDISETGKQNDNSTKQLKELKKKYAAAMKTELKKRTTYLGLLVHRLVADVWCVKSSDAHTLVLHKDFNKLNNHYTNLQWATMEECIIHQQKSPNTIADKLKRKDGSRTYTGNQKLTITRVMLIKKRLLEGRPMRQLARQFKVTETQIARIKKGENWAHVPAAS